MKWWFHKHKYATTQIHGWNYDHCECGDKQIQYSGSIEPMRKYHPVDEAWLKEDRQPKILPKTCERCYGSGVNYTGYIMTLDPLGDDGRIRCHPPECVDCDGKGVLNYDTR